MALYLFGVLLLLPLLALQSSALNSKGGKMDDEAIAAGFVFVDEICPGIAQCLRYSTVENFVGQVVHGYGGPRAIATRPAAEALLKVQSRVASDGYQLLIYDTYRPQKAVDHFSEWSEDPSDTAKQSEYYPRVNKSDFFDLGYVAKKSGHSRGSTVDLTLLPLNQSVEFPPKVETRRFQINETDTVTLPFLQDQSVDMGTSFDLMDVASHYACSFVSSEAQRMRTYLREVMIEAGFRPYDEEWWHFTLNDEPYPDTYFNFDVPL